MGCRREEVHGLAELTGSCFFNYRQMYILRMLVYGLTDLFFVGGIAFFLSRTAKRSALETGVYFLVPFLMTGCVQFTLLLFGFGRKNHYGLIASGLLMTAGWSGAASHPGIYEPAALTVWITALILCIFSYGIEAAATLRQMERGDLLCMN